MNAFSAPTWIWYPGDYDIWLGNQVQNRRTERGTFFPPFWKMDSHYVLVEFSKKLDLSAEETINIKVEGQYNVKLDGKLLFGSPEKVVIPAGKHALNIKVHNQSSVPAIFVYGKTVQSDNSWKVTFEDKEWIDESGKASDTSSGTVYMNAASWNFNSAETLPSEFKLATHPMSAVSSEKKNNGMLYDFGKETFGFAKFNGLKGKGILNIYYGESLEEALSTEHCETLDRLSVDYSTAKDYTAALSKAFRYIYVEKENTLTYDSLSMLYEYLPLEYKGSFRCNDEQINKIWDVAAYTLHLTTREFFIDGIKRDRWLWSGDAYQSFLMNYYLFNDSPSVERTLFSLRGKDPVTGHINTIMDYTFYWFLGIYDYYLYTGDESFIRQNYDRMQSLMNYVLGRRNKDGLLEGLPGDWIFIDWATGLSKKGEVSFEQMLFARSLETMALCAGIANDEKAAATYQHMADDLKKKLFDIYWNESKQALVHSRVEDKQTDNVTRYANMFGIFFDYFNEQQKQAVKQSVLLNNNIQKITTPYMRFYELEALCAMGEQSYVMKEMKDYWGGMLKLGATSFWEEYDPSKKGAEHYAMYGREFGKSLCHAWGASPIYLLGKYYLGVRPLSPGYATYEVKPQLGGLEWMEGDVPTPKGKIHLYVSKKQMKIKSDQGQGTVLISSKKPPVCKNATLAMLSNGLYSITVAPNMAYEITYEAP
jgi:alpha-L-rhamnosidase